MTIEAAAVLTAELPGVLPDNRVVSRQRVYGELLSELTFGALYVRGLVGDLGLEGVESLKELLKRSPDLQLQLVVAICPGSRTWDDVLLELLQLQEAATARVQILLLARRVGPERSANLLWIQPAGGDHGHVVVGNVGNLLTATLWDPTDAVLGLPLEPLAADALRKWFDGLFAHCRPLNKDTARAPKLSLPKGDEEGQRLWRAYLEVLDGKAAGVVAPKAPVIDEETGEVCTEPEAAPPKLTFPRPDPVLLAVQQVLARGSVVSLDQASRAPPLSAPVPAGLFGERPETRSGSARMRRAFTVSLFDDDVRTRLRAKKTVMTSRLAACSLMLRDGLRWVPDTANELLKIEFDAVEKDAEAALKKEIGDKAPKDFVEGRMEKIAEDCKALAAEIAPNRPLPRNFVENVKSDLIARLSKNLEVGMAPGLSRSRYQIVLAENGREGPWDQVQTFLVTAARVPREIISEPRRKSALVVNQTEFLAAFNVFGDPLVLRHLDGERVDWLAREQLSLIETILDRPNATPKQRAHALFALISDRPREAVEAALTEEKTI